MRLLASDLMTLHWPSCCDVRVYLRAKGELEAGPSAFELVLREMGRRHEAQHLATLGAHADLSGINLPERFQCTADAIASGAAVIYQPAFTAKAKLSGTEAEIVGIPDFLVRDSGGYSIRDSKLSRRITEKDHPEIVLQLQLFGWLFRQATGQMPKSLQVHSGTGDVVPVPFDGGTAALDALSRTVAIRQLAAEPYEPLGWTKCLGCGFNDYCWKAAEARNDVALVMDVDQGLARALHGIGVNTPQQLLQQFTTDDLANFKRPWGSREQKVGKGAARILQLAEVAISKQERILAAPAIPGDANFVMFDLEGMPPYLEDESKIYLWGMQVFGAKPTAYIAATADFGPDGDKAGWFAFLRQCGELFKAYGNIRFVHWAPYEKTNITHYMERYGDQDGIAASVKGLLLDLLTVARDSLLLPLPSLSLKVVEKYIGFKRTQTEYGGDWSMAKFIEATETEDEAKRQQMMDEILVYNREDLEAMWAVFEWMRGKKPCVRTAEVKQPLSRVGSVGRF
jgi:predicted RecB family nuclease